MFPKHYGLTTLYHLHTKTTFPRAMFSSERMKAAPRPPPPPPKKNDAHCSTNDEQKWIFPKFSPKNRRKNYVGKIPVETTEYSKGKKTKQKTTTVETLEYSKRKKKKKKRVETLEYSKRKYHTKFDRVERLQYSKRKYHTKIDRVETRAFKT